MVNSIQAVFIDRDGTIGGNEEVILPGEFQIFSFTKASINQLKGAGKLVFSFTNQPVISKGEAKREDFERELVAFGFDGVYLCPHQHHEGCACRKPSAGMLEKAAREYKLDLRNCVVIGDRWTDLLAANEAGCLKVLVKTGVGTVTYERYRNDEYYGKWSEIAPDFVAENLEEAVDWVLRISDS
ncbi:HAD-IIIA family hydrolase [Cytobacillus sp. FJAT-54145]|uniref:D,D-heptose 1,7-bisphosphate phosphatase n=1 Tax=Cytobacillus spartinae TaxID=3299023 RepID=A0ABW6KD56_9BACI